MKIFRLLMLLGIAASFTPLAATMLASAIAAGHGCMLHEGFVNPCVIGGVDRGATLTAMFVSGWYMLFTLPAGVTLLLLWLVAEVVMPLVRWGRGKTRA